MLNWTLRKIMGTKNERELKRMAPVVARVNELEPRMKALRTEEMPRLTAEWKEQVQKGRKLEDVLPEAFALVREASLRTLGMRHFDVQLIGGNVLHEGKIAEMKTGEGKTLVATLPCYLNALSGRGVHVVTVNDYLARRDAEWMGRLYKTLGMRTGVVVHGLTDAERQDAYGADITYGQNNEFGFDYLRDNMKFRLQDYVQRELNFAIVDEVDSILIDEARTPLIISGPSDESSEKYYQVNRLIPSMIRDVDFTVDEKSRTVVMSDAGVEKMEQKLGIRNLYDPEQIEWLHHVEQALRAHHLYRNEVDYVVKEGEVLIVDEFTGRLMPGRRWSDGLHQAVEAKEGVKIEAENQTLATISFQNYFRMYSKLAGMTGTAETEAEEFAKIYDLDVVCVPTNKVNIRSDSEDLVYKTEREKFNAICDEIGVRHAKGQPILVGTVSVAKSEVVASLLKKRGIPHNVLNAKHHQREAEIVAQAGRKGAVTISTNMAGRGTDILLGGNPEMMAKHEVGPEPDAPMEGELEEAFQARKVDWAARLATRTEELKVQTAREHEEVVAAGGLHIVGTERHESRRIDNQLRGRAGRQGDPGSSIFFLSLEDDLMRIFASERIAKLMETLGMKEGEQIEHRMLTRSIEGAQKKVEAHNFDIRKNLLDYDDVMNQQRKSVYRLRRMVLGLRGRRAGGRVRRRSQVEEEDPHREGLRLERRGRALPRPLRRPGAGDGGRLLPGLAQGLGPPGPLAPGARAVRRGDDVLRPVDLQGGRGPLGARGADLQGRREVPPPEGGPLRPGRRGRAPPAPVRAVPLPPGHRRPLEGPPAADGPPAAGHRPARLRPARPEAGVQEGRLRDVHPHDLERAFQRGGERPPARAGAAGDRPGDRAEARGAGQEAAGHREPPRRGRRGRGSQAGDGHPRAAQGRAQRPVPLRVGQEVQEVPRGQ